MLGIRKERTRMSNAGFTKQHQIIGRVAAWAYVILSIIYALAMTLGLLSLKLPDEPIGDPYFTIMELLIVLIAPVAVLLLSIVYARTNVSK